MTYKELKNYVFTFGKYKGKKIKDIIDLSKLYPEQEDNIIKFGEYINWCHENVTFFKDGHAIMDAINARVDKILKKAKKKNNTAKPSSQDFEEWCSSGWESQMPDY